MENIYKAVSENVKLVGRTYFDGEKLWCGLSGSGISFKFKGEKCSIKIGGDSIALSDGDNSKSRFAILVNGDRSAKCDEAVYTKADGKVVMSGKEVVVQRAKDQMTGTQITIWLNEERVECYPARMILEENTVNSKKGGAGNILPK